MGFRFDVELKRLVEDVVKNGQTIMSKIAVATYICRLCRNLPQDSLFSMTTSLDF